MHRKSRQRSKPLSPWVSTFGFWRFDNETTLLEPFARRKIWERPLSTFSPHRSLHPYIVQIIDLSAEHRLAAIYQWKEHVEAGGLLSYGPSLAAMFRQTGTIVVKILKGAKPSDLPVEQPTKFELAVNARTAKALGLAIPPSILIRADEVIE